MTWADILASIRKKFLLLALVPLVFCAAGVGYLVVTEPVYRSEAVIFPVSTDDGSGQIGGLAGQFGGLASLAGIDLPGDGSAAVSLALLRSRQLAEQFVTEFDLKPILFASDWDAGRQQWLDEEPSLEELVRRFDEDVRTIVDDQTDGSTIVRVEWTDPSLAAQWAAGLVAMANENLRRRAIEEARASMEYLENELQTTSVVGMQDAIYGLMEAEMQTVMLANVRPEYAFRIIDPPRVSDLDDAVWPNPAIILAAALFCGLALALLIAVLTVSPRSS